jgi:dinuclear metal center YbgI/SA1388 family protein
MKADVIIRALEQWASLGMQEDFDNSGLQVGNKNTEISQILLSLDCTDEVVNEAIDLGCEMIITHHPLIFKGIKSLTGKNETERIIIKAVHHNLVIYAMHTNLDQIAGGVSHALADQLGLTNQKVLVPMSGKLNKLVCFCPDTHVTAVRDAIFEAGAGHIGNYSSCSFNLNGMGTFKGEEGSNPFVGAKGHLHQEPETRIETVFPKWRQAAIIQAMLKAHPYEEVAFDIYHLENTLGNLGLGVVGELQNATKEIELLELIKEKTGIPMIRHSGFSGKMIKKVALCGGAGSSFIPQAKMAGADAYLTGDIRYHDFASAEGQLLIADIGHFESEQFALEKISHAISEIFPNFAVHFTKLGLNPVKYY